MVCDVKSSIFLSTNVPYAAPCVPLLTYALCPTKRYGDDYYATLRIINGITLESVRIHKALINKRAKTVIEESMFGT